MRLDFQRTNPLEQMQTTLRTAQRGQFDLVAIRMGFAQPRTSTPGIFDQFMNRRFEQQIARIEKLLDRLTTILDRLSDSIGGKECWSKPHRGGNGWTTGWAGGGNADPGQVIAGKGRIWGDPHFIGADGGKYDVQGEAGKIYNLLSDDGFQMNGRFDRWGSGGATVVGEVGINAKGDIVRVKADGTATVNGREVKDGETVRLTNGGHVTRRGKEIFVESGEWKVDFQAHDSRNGAFLNMDVKTDNAVADGVKPHGLLGQTFDGDGIARNGDKGAGAQGGGAIENLALIQTERGDKSAVVNYEVASLTDTNFTSFNRFRDLSGAPFAAKFDDFFARGFGTGDVAMRAFGKAYAALSLSIVASTGPGGWSGWDWQRYG